MKILVDENVPRLTAARLRELGHDVMDIRGTADEGIDDESIWRLAQTESRLLITTDKGFSTRRGEQHHGILIVRLRQPNRKRIHSAIIRAFDEIGEDDWLGLLVVVRDRALSRFAPH
jgi:predicted nuclease of predicted toxin-antitoxin system